MATIQFVTTNCNGAVLMCLCLQSPMKIEETNDRVHRTNNIDLMRNWNHLEFYNKNTSRTSTVVQYMALIPWHPRLPPLSWSAINKTSTKPAKSTFLNAIWAFHLEFIWKHTCNNKRVVIAYKVSSAWQCAIIQNSHRIVCVRERLWVCLNEILCKI